MENYEVVVWSECVHSEPDNTNKYHMEMTANSKKVKIRQDGYYNVQMTALMQVSLTAQVRAEVFKISSKDSSCVAATMACTPIIQLRGQVKYESHAGDTDVNKNYDQRTSSGEGIYKLCKDDELKVIVSRNQGKILVDTAGARTSFTVKT